MHLDTLRERLVQTLQAERAAGFPKNLAERSESVLRRQTMRDLWREIQAALTPLHQEIKNLPALPPEEEIVWAQTVLAMPNLAVMETDTTGLEADDEIIRFTLVDRSRNVIDDVFIRPTYRQVSHEASRVNGITQSQVEL